ncbi:RNA exonuclease 1 homolog isoform X1 [Hydra vulgaris]|nr:RNA exonuclease 1 homolog isoform X1 [Hydra vulgaris]
MFPSKGYFRNAVCPFYQHGLCHRPYCHFKHAKEEQQINEKQRVNKEHKVIKEDCSPQFHKEGTDDVNKPLTSVLNEHNYEDDDNDEVMKIVKNISPSKLFAYAQRKQEERELQKTLAEIDEENKIKKNSLTEAFYNKTLNYDKKVNCLEDITQTLIQIPTKKVCECDDPDCSGFVDDHSSGLKTDSSSFLKNMDNKNENTIISKSIKKLSDVSFFATEEIQDLKKRKRKSNAEKSESSSFKKKLLDGKFDSESEQKDDFNLTSNIPQNFVKNKRIAHSKTEVSKSGALISTNVTKISPSAALISTTKISPSITTSAIDVDKYTAETGIYLGKKRQAHVSVVPVINSESFTRPKLKVEYGSKIAHNLRQLYLNKIIDEFIPKCQSEADACEKGFAEEATAYQRSNRKQTYLNLCANIVKKIRSLPAYVPPDTEENLNTSKTETNRLMTSSITGYQKLNQKIYTALPKKIIKPVSPALVIAGSTAKVTDISQRRLSSEPIELNEDTFYTYLQDYLLSDGQLWENKYPLIDPNNDKMAIIKDYSPLPRNSLKRQCCRCGKDYFMNAKGKYITKEECNFHWGKLRRVKEKGLFSTQYSCCQSSESGKPCSFSRLHVCDKMTPLNEFVSTRNCINVDAKQKVLALDCEMCYTTQGLELTRLTIVDFQLQPMIDLYVKPTNPIVDYNTRFSGVTKEHLQNITTTLEDIQDILLDILHKDTILLGHSLESDLFALKMIHKKVVDTSIVFPHRLGHPFKRALRNLMADHLQKIIQNGEAGHDSSEDARACMELMKYKFKEDMKKKNRSAISLPSFYSSKSI